MDLRIPMSKEINLHMSKSVSDIRMHTLSSVCLAINDMPVKQKAILGDYSEATLMDMYGKTLGQLGWR